MKAAAQRRSLASRALPLLFLYRSSSRGVYGLASKYSLFYDKDCEVDSGVSTLTFGARGDTGVIRFEDETCTEVISEDVDSPSCQGVDSSSDEDCSYNGGACSSTTECTDDDGSTVTHFFSPDDDTCSGEVWSQVNGPTEYAVPSCSRVAVDGLYYSPLSCTTDAATVWLDTPAPTFAPTETDIFHSAYTPAPTAVSDYSTSADTPAPKSDTHNGGTAGTPSPDTNDGYPKNADTQAPTVFDEDHMPADTPVPANDIDENVALDTPAPTSGSEDKAVASATAAPATDTPAPAVVDNGDNVYDGTPAPVATDTRGISVTGSPVGESADNDIEETTAPVGLDEASVANGAPRGGGRDAAYEGFVLSIAMGIWVFFAV
eukprot:jgi/Undpi1/9359/HiC_scaffold_26.g11817.m1